MDKQQADAIARAILEPDHQHREELARKRALEKASLARRRKVAWFTLAGCAIGTGTAYVLGSRITGGALWGGIIGTLVGWAVVSWRMRQGAA